MQDSIEDYIKIASVGKDKPSNFDDEKLNRLKTTLAFKKQAEEYAQRIVEILIEGKLRPQIFIRSLSNINEDLYDDVVDERAITKLCGYPICGNVIPVMPIKKYVILAKVNKVYDLTDRKKFCSNFCYKASMHVKKQIDNSPLWLRKTDTPYEFNLLPYTNAGLAPGDELVNSAQLPSDELEKGFTSVSAFTEACLEEAEENLPDDDEDKCCNKISERNQVYKSILKPSCLGTNEQPSTSRNIQHVEKKTVQFIDDSQEKSMAEESEQEELNRSIQNICRSLNITLDFSKQQTLSEPTVDKQDYQINVEKMNKVIEKVNEAEKLRMKPPILIDIPITATTKPVEQPKFAQRIIEITSHKDSVQEKDDMHKILAKMKKIQLNKKKKPSAEDDKMQEILEKLRMKRATEKQGVIMVETNENPEVHKASTEQAVKTPNAIATILSTMDCTEIIAAFRKWLTLETFLHLYGEEKVREMLSSDKFDSYFNEYKMAELELSQKMKYYDICKRLQLKEAHDRKFDDICMSNDVMNLKPVPCYETLKAEVEAMNLKTQAFYTGQIVVNKKQNVEKKDDENREVVLPLVDISNATALRRNVFNKSILPYIQNHLWELSLAESTLCKLQELMQTFKLDANNVVFKPAQWNAIALILINCLSKFDTNVQTSLESTTYIKNFKTKLSDVNLLEDCNSIIEQVDMFIADHILRNN